MTMLERFVEQPMSYQYAPCRFETVCYGFLGIGNCCILDHMPRVVSLMCKQSNIAKLVNKLTI